MFIIQFKERVSKLEIHDLRILNDILQEALYMRYQHQDANQEVSRVIQQASSLDEFVTMWKGNKFAEHFDTEALQGFWQEFTEGKAGDNQ